MSHPSRAYCRVVLATLCGLGNLECDLGHLKVWSTLSLLHACYIAEAFPCLGLYMFYVSFENTTTVVIPHVFQYGIIQQEVSYKMLEYLKGVIPKKAQVKWSQALS